MAVVTTNTNLSALSYTAGETITIQGGATLTMNATPTVRPGIIQCIRSGKFSIVNPSTTTPIVLESDSHLSDLRFEGNGVLEVRGNMIEIWTSDGTYKSWDFSTLYSGAYTDITHVEVETAPGSGVYQPWRTAEITPHLYAPRHLANSFGAATKTGFEENQQVLFWNSLTKVLETGDGTNGKLIPNGCKVRIPNILITNQYHVSDEAQRHNLTGYSAPTAGTFTITVTNRRTGTVIGTTTDLPYNASLAAVDAALEAVLGIPITTAGGPLPATILITQAGIYTGTPLAFTVNSSVTGGADAVIATTGYAGTDMQLLDLNPSGTFDGEGCMFSRKIYVVNSSFSRFRAVHCGFAGNGFQLSSSNGSVELDNVSCAYNPYFVAVQNVVLNIAGEVSLNRVVMNVAHAAPGYIGTLSNLTRFADVESHSYATQNRTTSSYAMYIQSINNVDIIRPVTTCGKMIFVNCGNLRVIEPKQCDNPSSTQSTLAIAAIEFVNTVDTVIFNLTHAGTASARLAVFLPDAATANIQVIDGTYDGANNTQRILGPVGDGFTITNFKASNLRTGPIIDLPTAFTSKSTIMKKTPMSMGTGTDPVVDTGQDNIYDLVGCTYLGFNAVNSSVENFVGGNFTDLSMTPTTGNVIFGGFGQGTSLTRGGGTYTDQIGSIYLPTDGDTAIATMPFTMHGITSFQNAYPYLIGETLGGKANQWRIMNDGGVTGGTFRISVYDSSGTLLGTTIALAYNASVTTVDTALGTVTGSAGYHTVAGSLTAGYVITFASIYATTSFTLTVDGSLLTGGTSPGTARASAIFSRKAGEELDSSSLIMEYQVKNPTDDWDATWYAINGTNLSGAISALAGYDAGIGLDMRVKFTAVGDDDYRRIQLVAMPTNLDVTTYSPPDSTITFHGVNTTDVAKIYDMSHNLLYTFTGSGLHEFAIGANLDKEAYIVRENSSGVAIMRTQSTPFTLTFGNNGEFDLFAGAEVQLAQSPEVTEIQTAVAALDVGLTPEEHEQLMKTLTTGKFIALN